MGIACFNNSMVNEARQKAIKELAEMRAEIQAIENYEEVRGIDAPEIKKQLRQRRLYLENQVATSLPIEIEGFLGEDIADDADRDERGTIREVYYYLGCPRLLDKDSKFYGTVDYDKFKDITEILQQNTGKFLRVTIEEIPIGETNACAKCDNKFRCLTTKV